MAEPARAFRFDRLLSACLACLWLGGCGSAPAGTSRIAVDSAERFQTWQAWQVSVTDFHHDDPSLGDEYPVPQKLVDEIIDDAVSELGVTSMRHSMIMMTAAKMAGLEESNDNDDPFVLEEGAFRWHWLDPYVRAEVLPFKRRVEAAGQRFLYTVQVVSWHAWQWQEPEEYAEFVVACLERLRSRYGLVPDYFSPYNEPDFVESDPAVVIPAVRATLRRMDAAGFGDVKLAFPEVSRIENAERWLEAFEQGAPEFVPRLGLLSFHLYGRPDASFKLALRAHARRLGVPTAQTELWPSRDHPRQIYAALTQADAVLYEPFILAHPNEKPLPGDGYSYVLGGGKYPRYDYRGKRRGINWEVIRHYARCVKPGRVRVAAESEDAELLPVAFIELAGAPGTAAKGACTIVHNAGSEAKAIEISGLGAGLHTVWLLEKAGEAQALLPVEAVAGVVKVEIPPAATLGVLPAAG